MLVGLEGRVVIVTGAAQGVGRATALRAAQAGAVETRQRLQEQGRAQPLAAMGRCDAKVLDRANLVESGVGPALASSAAIVQDSKCGHRVPRR